MKYFTSITAAAFLLSLAPSVVIAKTPQCSTTEPRDDYYYKIWYPEVLSSPHQCCIMGQGAQGSAVVEVQKAYNHCYAKKESDKLTPDGNYGALTAAAVRKIQAAEGVTQDGIWGDQTGQEMDWWSLELSSNKMKCWYDSSKYRGRKCTK